MFVVLFIFRKKKKKTRSASRAYPDAKSRQVL